MAKTSVQEQASTGLNQLNDRKYERFQTLNQIYRKKFGFPFVMAVKGHTTESIQTIFEQRLGHDRTDEIGRARLEISKIARFRLDEMIER